MQLLGHRFKSHLVKNNFKKYDVSREAFLAKFTVIFYEYSVVI